MAELVVALTLKGVNQKYKFLTKEPDICEWSSLPQPPPLTANLRLLCRQTVFAFTEFNGVFVCTKPRNSESALGAPLGCFRILLRKC